MKYRIIRRQKKFYIQKRGIFGWKDWFYKTIKLYGFPVRDQVSFDSIYDAEDFLINYQDKVIKEIEI